MPTPMGMPTKGDLYRHAMDRDEEAKRQWTEHLVRLKLQQEQLMGQAGIQQLHNQGRLDEGAQRGSYDAMLQNMRANADLDMSNLGWQKSRDLADQAAGFQMGRDQYGFNTDVAKMGLQNRYQTGRDERQNQFDVGKMGLQDQYQSRRDQAQADIQSRRDAVQHRYGRENMGLANEYQQGNMGLANEYQQDNMGLANEYQQDNMGLLHDYNRDSASQQNQFQTGRDERQEGYAQAGDVRRFGMRELGMQSEAGMRSSMASDEMMNNRFQQLYQMSSRFRPEGTLELQKLQKDWNDLEKWRATGEIRDEEYMAARNQINERMGKIPWSQFLLPQGQAPGDVTKGGAYQYRTEPDGTLKFMGIDSTLSEQAMDELAKRAVRQVPGGVVIFDHVTGTPKYHATPAGSSTTLTPKEIQAQYLKAADHMMQDSLSGKGGPVTPAAIKARTEQGVRDVQAMHMKLNNPAEYAKTPEGIQEQRAENRQWVKDNVYHQHIRKNASPENLKYLPENADDLPDEVWDNFIAGYGKQQPQQQQEQGGPPPGPRPDMMGPIQQQTQPQVQPQTTSQRMGRADGRGNRPNPPLPAYMNPRGHLEDVKAQQELRRFKDSTAPDVVKRKAIVDRIPAGKLSAPVQSPFAKDEPRGTAQEVPVVRTPDDYKRLKESGFKGRFYDFKGDEYWIK